ncbi:hypothetical protein TWF506_010604 [Arthrobotrys conoides]|uniref:Uncharacterized protein n=1 Tax=Arthrobotrys conoides TaxID=74498 RepID=A0AAN8RL27_9PEZI
MHLHLSTLYAYTHLPASCQLKYCECSDIDGQVRVKKRKNRPKVENHHPMQESPKKKEDTSAAGTYFSSRTDEKKRATYIHTAKNHVSLATELKACKKAHDLGRYPTAEPHAS